MYNNAPRARFSSSVGNGLFNSASLDLYFAKTKNLVDAHTGANLVTFTRASSGTFVGSNGLIQSATTNEARFDHNPTTGESLGLLVEEARTNLFLQSNAFTTTWSNTDTVATATQTTAPDGTNAGWKLAAGTGTTNHNVFQSIAFTAVATTASVFVKYLDHRWVGIRIGLGASQFFGSWDLQNGVVGSVTAGATIGMRAVGNGWYRLTLTATLTTAGSANCIIGLNNADALALTSYTGTGTGIYLFGAQLETGAFPTSYIPTTTATVTRAADVASITGTNFSSWYNQAAQTWFGEYAPIYNASATVPANTPHLLQVYNTAVNNNNYAVRGAEPIVNQLFVARNPTVGLQLPTNTGIGFGIAGTYRKVSFGIDSSTLNVSTNRTISSVANNVAALMATHDILSIGSGTGGTPPYQLNGTIRRLVFWPTRLPNNTLQAITQP